MLTDNKLSLAIASARGLEETGRIAPAQELYEATSRAFSQNSTRLGSRLTLTNNEEIKDAFTVDEGYG